MVTLSCRKIEASSVVAMRPLSCAALEDFGGGGIEHLPRHIGGSGFGVGFLEGGQGGFGGQAAGDVAVALAADAVRQNSDAAQLLRARRNPPAPRTARKSSL